MHRTQRLNITTLNQHLICVLCQGYLVDATTIIECLHSFCRSCILRYFETSKLCPICDAQVHKTKPEENIRPDKTLQALVYKLVPSLFKNEMKRRREFYSQPSHSAYDRKMSAEARGGVCPTMYDSKEKSEEQASRFSLILQHCAFLPPLNSNGTWDQAQLRDENADVKYLDCPSNVTMSALRHFVRTKYDLDPKYEIDLFHSDEGLRDHYTLSDVAFVYDCDTDTPLKLFYLVYDSAKEKSPIPYYKAVLKTRKRRARKRKQSSVDSVDSEEDVLDDASDKADRVLVRGIDDESPATPVASDDKATPSPPPTLEKPEKDPSLPAPLPAKAAPVSNELELRQAQKSKTPEPVIKATVAPPVSALSQSPRSTEANDTTKRFKATAEKPVKTKPTRPSAARKAVAPAKIMNSAILVEETPSEVVQVNGSKYNNRNYGKATSSCQQPPLDGLQKLVNDTHPLTSKATSKRPPVCSVPRPVYMNSLRETSGGLAPVAMAPTAGRSLARLAAPYSSPPQRLPDQLQMANLMNHVNNNNIKMDAELSPPGKRHKCNHSNGMCEGHDPMERLLDEAHQEQMRAYASPPGVSSMAAARPPVSSMPIRTPDPRMRAYARVPGPGPPERMTQHAWPRTNAGSNGFPDRVPPGRHHNVIRTRSPIASQKQLGNHRNLSGRLPGDETTSPPRISGAADASSNSRLPASLGPQRMPALNSPAPGCLQQGAHQARAHGNAPAMHRMPQTIFSPNTPHRFDRPVSKNTAFGRSCNTSLNTSLSPNGSGDGYHEPLDFTMKRQDNESPVASTKDDNSPPGPTLLRVPSVNR